LYAQVLRDGPHVGALHLPGEFVTVFIFLRCRHAFKVRFIIIISLLLLLIDAQILLNGPPVRALHLQGEFLSFFYFYFTLPMHLRGVSYEDYN